MITSILALPVALSLFLGSVAPAVPATCALAMRPALKSAKGVKAAKGAKGGAKATSKTTKPHATKPHATKSEAKKPAHPTKSTKGGSKSPKSLNAD